MEHYHSDYPLYVVVKSNAYGHGLSRVVRTLYDIGHRKFGVFHMKEAIPLRQHFPDIDVLIMGDIPSHYIPDIKSLRLDIGVFNEEKWRFLLQHDISGLHLHIMLETGLNRMGIKNVRSEEFLDLARKSTSKGSILSFYSHISAVPEGPHTERVGKQYAAFDNYVDFIQAEIPETASFHLYNSANLPYTQEHKYGARIGLLLYGYAPLEAKPSFPWLSELKPVMEYHSWIMQIKSVPKGEYIGYSLHYQCPEDKRVAYIPLGYADGLFRRLGNRGRILTDAGLCPILGILNMNLLAIDVTDCPSLKQGDRVTILGRNTAGMITADDHAETADTISYEVLCAMGNQAYYGMSW